MNNIKSYKRFTSIYALGSVNIIMSEKKDYKGEYKGIHNFLPLEKRPVLVKDGDRLRNIPGKAHIMSYSHNSGV